MKERKIALTPTNYKEFLPINIIAFSFAEGGAMGDGGSIIIVSDNGMSYYLNYVWDDWSEDCIYEICPVLKECSLCAFERIKYPKGWIYRYMGVGNHLLVHELLEKQFSEATKDFQTPVEYYQKWEQIIEKITSENCNTRKEISLDRITPEMVTSLNENEIFVFGSNTYGEHNGGASAYALHYFSAINGQAEGIQGQSYAIPTDGVNINELYLGIRRFHNFAQAHPELKFYVTRIGCGTAGWSVYNIAPMFANCAKLDNVKLPKEFWDYL